MRSDDFLAFGYKYREELALLSTADQQKPPNTVPKNIHNINGQRNVLLVIRMLISLVHKDSFWLHFRRLSPLILNQGL